MYLLFLFLIEGAFYAWLHPISSAHHIMASIYLCILISFFSAKGISEFVDTLVPHEKFSNRILMFLLVIYTLGDFEKCCHVGSEYLGSISAFLTEVTTYNLSVGAMVLLFDVKTAKEQAVAFVLPFATGYVVFVTWMVAGVVAIGWTICCAGLGVLEAYFFGQAVYAVMLKINPIIYTTFLVPSFVQRQLYLSLCILLCQGMFWLFKKDNKNFFLVVAVFALTSIVLLRFEDHLHFFEYFWKYCIFEQNNRFTSNIFEGLGNRTCII